MAVLARLLAVQGDRDGRKAPLLVRSVGRLRKVAALEAARVLSDRRQFRLAASIATAAVASAGAVSARI
jgi:hypothetical protein